MMRGEEPLDLQRLMRTEHRECMKVGSVKLICDADTDIGDQNSDYTEFWPYEERPKITGVVPEE